MSVPCDRSALLTALPGVRHGFFGRRGGVSTGTFASLNMSSTGGDDPALVAENRARAVGTLDLVPERLVVVAQVHSSDVLTLDAPFPGPPPPADALVTRAPGLVLGILTADCAPVLLADAQAGVIGAFHAGWKGALGGIAANTVQAMVALGATPDRIVAAIGPTISEANYEVGPEFASDLLRRYPEAARRVSAPAAAREHFDLPGFVSDRLRAAGVRSIDDLGLCTYAEPERFFSHRHATHSGTTTGRQIALIALS